MKLSRTVYRFTAFLGVLFVFLAAYMWSVNDVEKFGFFFVGAILLAGGGQFLYVMTNKYVKQEKEREERLKRYYGGDGGCS